MHSAVEEEHSAVEEEHSAVEEEHSAVEEGHSVQCSGGVQWTVQWVGPASSAPSQPPLESVNSRLSSSEEHSTATHENILTD